MIHILVLFFFLNLTTELRPAGVSLSFFGPAHAKKESDDVLADPSLSKLPDKVKDQLFICVNELVSKTLEIINEFPDEAEVSQSKFNTTLLVISKALNPYEVRIRAILEAVSYDHYAHYQRILVSAKERYLPGSRLVDFEIDDSLTVRRMSSAPAALLAAFTGIDSDAEESSSASKESPRRVRAFSLPGHLIVHEERVMTGAFIKEEMVKYARFVLASTSGM